MKIVDRHLPVKESPWTADGVWQGLRMKSMNWSDNGEPFCLKMVLFRAHDGGSLFLETDLFLAKL